MPIDPNTGQEQSAQSLLDLMPQAGGQGDPYGGRTWNQIVEGGNPYGDTYMTGAPVNGPGDGSFANWQNQLATNANVSDAIQRGGRYRPEFAKTLQSSGQEGGFFSIPGITAGTEIPWGYYPNPNDPNHPASGDPNAKNPAPGLIGMSTNNWRLLPKQFQDPRWAMRAGHIIERYYGDKPGAYIADRGGAYPSPSNAQNLGPGGHGYPYSWGYPFGPRSSFFPGQLEPATPESGQLNPGVT